MVWTTYDEIIIKQEKKMAETIKSNYSCAHFVEIIKNNEEKCRKIKIIILWRRIEFRTLFLTVAW